jgi:3-oxoacyl-[acyl-carrier protein] reductase
MPAADARVALVTGSSRGLGAVIARRLAHDGFAVAVNGRRGDGQAGQVARAIAADDFRGLQLDGAGGRSV